MACAISKILFILGLYDVLAYLECIRSYAWSKGCSDPDLSSVVVEKQMNYKNQVLLLVEVHNLISSSEHNKKPISLHFNRCNRTTRWRTCPVFVQKHSVCFYKNRSYEKSKHLRQLEFQILSPEKTKMDFYLVVAFILFSKLQDLNF